jgi:hypothetical protein
MMGNKNRGAQLTSAYIFRAEKVNKKGSKKAQKSPNGGKPWYTIFHASLPP